jgi:solute carrier family 25 (mitochondrial oxoglutarate transporter), member 11
MRQAVYGTARLGLHREFSDLLIERQGGGVLPAHMSVAASMTSGAIASLIGNPFDVALVRMQSDTMRPAAERRNYSSVFNALARIAREEGIARLWRGCEPTVLRAMAMNVGMMASYDQSKALYQGYLGKGITANLLASATAGFTCAFASLPFDMIKTRLQSMKADPKTGLMPYKGVLDCARQIMVKEGFFAFWTGFWAYYGRCAPHAMIILITLEQFNRLYSSAFGTTYKH